MHRIDSFEKIDDVVGVLEQGGVIVYPTETVYGIGCLAGWHSALDRIAELKQSEPGSSYLVLIRGKKQLDRFCSRIPSSAKKLIDLFWPGPLTLVLPARDGLHPRLVGPSGGVALRQSSHNWPRALLERLDDGLVSTSANPSGKVPPSVLSDLDSSIAGKVDLVVDGGELAGGISTVLDLCEDPPQIRREGVITQPEIERLVGDANKED